ncbi:hypothetical protein [Frisingicoccus sp.]|uniref:hypothetical protein n=1 Tax=Frisingicoccus sp. TaxID=1918627 RepID=UPI003996B24E
MGVEYVADKYVDLGERIHLRCVVRPKCDQDIPFTIKNARWELYNSAGVLEDEGECEISGHELDAMVQPKGTGRYKFKFIYEVADEIWVDPVKLRVN